MNARASITAVVPVHNRADLLARLLESLAAQTLPFTQVIVIDNASTDGASDLARSHGCIVLPQAANTGFARAVNLGWRAAPESQWIAILNSDVTLHPHWLERLMAAASGASFATGTIFNATDCQVFDSRDCQVIDSRDCQVIDSRDCQVIDGTYDLLSRAGCAWRAGHGEQHAPPGKQSSIAMAPGTACLFRRDVLEQLNGFDEEFGSYLEDIDLGLRCLREGYEGIYVPDAVAWHRGSATLGRWNGRVVRLISRNQLLLVRRHYDRELFRACAWPILAGQMLWGLVALRHGAPFAWLAGKFDALKNFRLEGRPSARLRAFLAASEDEIRNRARDPYWRWYFRLTSPFRTAAH